MVHQNIQFIKILYTKINQGKNKTFMHNERFIHTILSKNPTISMSQYLCKVSVIIICACLLIYVLAGVFIVCVSVLLTRTVVI